MKRRLYALTASVLLGGCIFVTTPPNNAAFGEIRSLRDLEGIWKNHGEHNQTAIKLNLATTKLSLSNIIWPNTKLPHDSIDTIHVKAASGRELRVRALSLGAVVQESLFVEDQDFTIERGRILLRRKVGLAADVVLGPHFETVELGLDTKGQGKYRLQGGVVGLAYLLVPIVGASRDEIRFVRVSTP